MNIYQGKSAYNGIAIGPIHVIEESNSEIGLQYIKSVADEIERLDDAVQKAQAQLELLYNKAVNEVGQTDAEIFSIHQMMLEDEDYIDNIHESIESKKWNAEYAVSQAGKEFSQMFSEMDDEYMKARSTDVIDISNRLVNTLLGKTGSSVVLEIPSIVVANDLNPSITMEFDKTKVLAFVMKKGSLNSHTAILARMMSIPALVATNLDEINELNGRFALVDSNKGSFYI